METEFIFWRHETSAGIRVEEICGGEDKSAKLWKVMALQVFGENGTDRFREILHLPSGAPLLSDSEQRISISHTPHFMVIAFLPRTPEVNLEIFSSRTAMGVDCEPVDRGQVLKVADRILSEEEINLVASYAFTLEEGVSHHAPLPHDEAVVRANILAWTIKEALYKAALTPGIDFRTKLVIEKLPEICSNPMVGKPIFGRARVLMPDGKEEDMELFSYLSEGHLVTLAYSPKCAKFYKGPK